MRPILLSLGVALAALTAWAWWTPESPDARDHGVETSAHAAPQALEDAQDAQSEIAGGLEAEALAESSRDATAAAVFTVDAAPASRAVATPSTTHVFRVVDASTNEPMAGLALRARAGARTIQLTTDAGGGFSLDHSVNELFELEVVPDGAQPPRWSLLPNQVYAWRPIAGSSGPRPIRAYARAASIEIDVHDARGALLPNATVWLHATESADADAVAKRGLASARPPRRALTDERGRASFSTYESDATTVWIAFVDDERGTVSAPIVLRPPIAAAPSILRIEPGGSVTASVVDAQGRAIDGFTLHAALAVGDRATSTIWSQAITRGPATSRPLPPGIYAVRALHASGEREVADEAVVASGADTRVDLLFDGNLLDVAASGVVLDERGNPLPDVLLTAATRESPANYLRTRDDGAFTAWRAPAERVTVTIGIGADSDEFEPESVDVEFGSKDLVFRRKSRLPIASIWVRPIDGKTQQPVPDARLLLLRDGSASTIAWFDASTSKRARRNAVAMRERGLVFDEFLADAALPPDHVIEVAGKLRPIMRWRITAPGYVKSEGSVEDWLTTFDGKTPIDVALEPGFEATIRVIDKDTREPVPGVRCVDARELTLLGTSDGNGTLVLAGVEPPTDGALLEHPDYYTGTWDPKTRWTDAGATELWRRPAR